MPDKKYKELIEEETVREKLLKAKNDNYVNTRLVVFLLGVIISGFLFYKKSIIPAVLILAVFLTILVIVVVMHNKTRKHQRRSRALIAYFEGFLKRIGGGWTAFPDCGEEFIDPRHPYSSDLNIFGPKSLFQLVNLTHTFKGRHRLAELLKNPDNEMSGILGRQGAIKELTQKSGFIKELSLRGILNKKTAKNPEDLLNSMKSQKNVPTVLKNPVLIMGLPIITIVSSLFAGRLFPWLYIVVLSGIILQLLLFAVGFKLVSGQLSMVHQYKNELETYQQMIELIEAESCEDFYLKSLKSKLLIKSRRASDEIRSLSALSDYIDFKYSPLIYFILNALLLWDLNLNRLAEGWMKNNSANINQWLEVLAEFEALSSLSVIPMITPVYSYPVFISDKPGMKANDLAHPFIPCEKRIPNDVDINGVGIITGSNMSGKTTLLRTVGINLVLAYAGAPVIASYMNTGLMSIFTSMRNQDDLNEGISTFYAELVRIKKIVDKSKEGSNMIFLIDEIFKGTNSKDRIEGAKTVLKGLNKPWLIGLLTTHDYELCSLESENSSLFSNWHFTETYSNSQIHFDYKLNKGMCRTSNARYLMRMVGLE